VHRRWLSSTRRQP